MDAQLKTLKVVDLKAVLAKAQVHVPAKANKNDLVAKILASPVAIDVYKQLYDSDDLLAPPEDVDWSTEQEQQKPAAEPPAPIPDAVPATTVTTPSTEDLEAEKRRKRAERFGIPLVEAPKPRPARAPNASAVPDDTKNLEARGARFGTNTATTKRPAPTENVDPEEAEKRRKRAERFGTGPAAAKV
ncbi:SAP domain-containing ribonucleoprotein [Hypsizygus marmoreus]|uniref:SAP domain-containing ribonucleoprotein n=1 Tax=Hypsizygus marmoreus TaxID=39966 RepID=A0A369JYI4_HYPMA|nr:SAP domain-containing ribonucleoprotein [Hypsizygus marmoreus]